MYEENQNVYAPQQSKPVYNGGAGGPEIASAENYALGILGAFIFSLGGAVVYFALYQLNFIAGISGFIMFVLAQLGYNLFARTNKKTTVAGMITSVVMMLIMIFVAEYFCVSFEIYKAYQDMGITFVDAVVATPEFLADSEVRSAVLSDLIPAYGFGILAIAGNVATFFKQKKLEKAQVGVTQPAQQEETEINQ